MKKPKQTKSAKRQDAMQKAQRRNYQKNPTRRTGVHAVPDEPVKPTNLTAAPVVKRRPYKLHERTIGALIRSINDCADAPLECHIGAAGISKDTYYEWRKKAEADPKSEYGRQLTRVDRALYQAWRRLHEEAVKHKASEVLFRRHDEFYPSEKVRMDLTSGDLPIAAGNNFTVLLELHPPAGVPQQQSEKSFEVQEVTGERWKWSPEEDKRRRPGDNGKLPE